MTKQIKPNFLIVGAAKSGTTALANYLKQHPDIFIPEVKEPRYFAKNEINQISECDPLAEQIYNSSILDKTEYYNLFKDTEKYKCRGEASVHYLYHYESVIPKIQKEIGDVNIIILLRNPANRAFSNYYYLKKEKYSIEKALEMEKGRQKAGYNSFWFYKELGLYYNQIKAYLNNFKNVKIIIYEDFLKNPNEILKILFNFLQINHDFVINTNGQYNVTKIPKSNFYKVLLSFEKKADPLKSLLLLFAGERLRKYKKTWFSSHNYNIPQKTYNLLVDYYLEDIICVENLLDVDLSHWKQYI